MPRAKKPKCRCAANEPILEEILRWKTTVNQRQRGRGGRGRSGGHFGFALKKAAASIALYPLPIRTREDAESLAGVGPKISARMMRALVDKKESVPLVSDEKECRSKKKRNHSRATVSKLRRTSSMPASLRPNAVLIDMTDQVDEEVSDTRKRVRKTALQRTGSCFGAVTASSLSASTFAKQVSRELRQSTLSPHIRRSTSSCPKRYIFEGGSECWDVVMLLDNREVRSRRDRSFFESRLLEYGVNVETRQLPLGDMLWIARERGSSSSKKKNKEYVLGFIVERKKTSDLASSIIDGRYASQKHRLKQCGLHRIVYLVEGSLEAQDMLPAESLRISMLKTSAVDGFKVQHTRGADDSVRWMRQMHAHISQLVASGTDLGAFAEPVLSYTEWTQKLAMQNRNTVAKVFGSMLMQIKGCSAARVEAVLRRFPTPRVLVSELSRLEGGRIEGIEILKELKPTNHARRLGPTLAADIYDTWMGVKRACVA